MKIKKREIWKNLDSIQVAKTVRKRRRREKE
jgi:hypothetical protein